MRCANCSADYSIRPEDQAFYGRLSVPPPTWCPPCREMRRMAWCNEWQLYRSSCRCCGKNVVSQFAADNPREIFCVDCWWSDRWDALTYGREPDFTRSFFEQFHQLELSLPHACVATDLSNENSEYTHHAGQERNCYLIFHATYCEDCYYGYGVKKSRSCVDVHNCFESELCYQCIDVDKCYDLSWCQECFNCNTSSFLRDCIGCSDCFLCTGLRNRRHCYRNAQFSPDEYRRQIAAHDLRSLDGIEKTLTDFEQLQQGHSYKALRNVMAEESRGNHLSNVQRAHQCFDCRDAEDCAYCSQLQLGSRSSHDIYQFGVNMEMCYEGAMIGTNAYNIQFSNLCIWQVFNLQYCFEVYSSSDCFLCFGLKHHRFCILNRQYSEADYNALRTRIISKMTADGEYGEYFPIKYSPFGYNETSAQRWFPSTPAEVRKKGWSWTDLDSSERRRQNAVDPLQHLDQAHDGITAQAIRCRSCSNPFKIIKPELDFYRRRGIALPACCFDCRRAERMSRRSPRTLRETICSSCRDPVLTAFPAAEKRKILCESCYGGEP